MVLPMYPLSVLMVPTQAQTHKHAHTENILEQHEARLPRTTPRAPVPILADPSQLQQRHPIIINQ